MKQTVLFAVVSTIITFIVFAFTAAYAVKPMIDAMEYKCCR